MKARLCIITVILCLKNCLALEDSINTATNFHDELESVANDGINTIFHDELSASAHESLPLFSPTTAPATDNMVTMTFSMILYGISMSTLGVTEEKALCHAIAESFGSLQSKYVTLKSISDASEDNSLSLVNKEIMTTTNSATENHAICVTFNIQLSLHHSGFQDERSLFLATSSLLQGGKGVYSQSFADHLTTAASLVEANALLGVTVVPSTLSAVGFSVKGGSSVSESSSFSPAASLKASESSGSYDVVHDNISTSSQSVHANSVVANVSFTAADAWNSSSSKVFTFENGDFEEDAGRSDLLGDVTPTGWEVAEGISLVDCDLVHACKYSGKSSEVAILDREFSLLQHRIETSSHANLELKFSVFNFCRVCPCNPVALTVAVAEQVVMQYVADEENIWDNVVLSIQAPSDLFSLAFSTAGGDAHSCGLLLDDINVFVTAGSGSLATSETSSTVSGFTESQSVYSSSTVEPTVEATSEPTPSTSPSTATSSPTSKLIMRPPSLHSGSNNPTAILFSSGCPVEVSLQDTFGDSWNGARLMATNARSIRGDVNYLTTEDSVDSPHGETNGRSSHTIGFWPVVGGDAAKAYLFLAEDTSPQRNGAATELYVSTGNGEPPRESWEILWTVKVNGVVYTGDFHSRAVLRCWAAANPDGYSLHVESLLGGIPPDDATKCDPVCRAAPPLQGPPRPVKKNDKSTGIITEVVPGDNHGSSEEVVHNIVENPPAITEVYSSTSGVDHYSDYDGKRYAHVDSLIDSLAQQASKDDVSHFSDYEGKRYTHIDTILGSLPTRRLGPSPETPPRPPGTALLQDSSSIDTSPPKLPQHVTALALEFAVSASLPKSTPVPLSIHELPISKQVVTYVVSDKDRKRPLAQGSLCPEPGNPKRVCPLQIPDGDYILRVGGKTTPPVGASYQWSFCGVSAGKLQTELQFQVYKGKCWPGRQLTADEYQEFDTLVMDTSSTRLVLSGSVYLSSLVELRNVLTSEDIEVFGRSLSIALADQNSALARDMKVTKFAQTSTDSQTVKMEFEIRVPLSSLHQYYLDITETKEDVDTESSDSGFFNYEQVENLFYRLRSNLASFLVFGDSKSSQLFLELIRQQEVYRTGGTMIDTDTAMVISSVSSVQLVDIDMSLSNKDDAGPVISNPSGSSARGSYSGGDTTVATDSSVVFLADSKDVIKRGYLFHIALASGAILVFSVFALIAVVIFGQITGDIMRVQNKHEYVTISVQQ